MALAFFLSLSNMSENNCPEINDNSHSPQALLAALSLDEVCLPDSNWRKLTKVENEQNK